MPGFVFFISKETFIYFLIKTFGDNGYLRIIFNVFTYYSNKKPVFSKLSVKKNYL